MYEANLKIRGIEQKNRDVIRLQTELNKVIDRIKITEKATAFKGDERVSWLIDNLRLKARKAKADKELYDNINIDVYNSEKERKDYLIRVRLQAFIDCYNSIINLVDNSELECKRAIARKIELETQLKSMKSPIAESQAAENPNA